MITIIIQDYRLFRGNRDYHDYHPRKKLIVVVVA